MVNLKMVGGPQNGYEYEVDQHGVSVGQTARFGMPGDANPAEVDYVYHVVQTGQELEGHYVGVHANLRLENRPTATGFAEYLVGPCSVCVGGTSGNGTDAPLAAAESSAGPVAQTVAFLIVTALVIGAIVLVATVGFWNLVVVLICGLVILGVLGFVFSTLFG